ncbi:hypothetical protein LZP85_08845 [Priestia flexa]|jgi:hypothetical protein|uniref:Uncharacterized protein n=1 Tax=Priestia flexa TaxID=86664 RepID=A0A8I1MF24_9BACI|nr:hypothetical protein [Priestia flexa]MBN8251230.1 hypothetical protein [Priestia flexa]UIR31860.1 hypothetical protein LZP85_08845 [Priestia flexa]UZW65406.1 hypothetical protein OC195_14820 [Priestia flexa]
MNASSMFNPAFALVIFGVGIGLASMVDPLFGLLAIFGGALLGFSTLVTGKIELNKKAKLLLFASFVFLLSLFSVSYVIVSEVILRY